MLIRAVLLLLALGVVPLRVLAAPVEVVLYTYHDKPPYYVHLAGNKALGTGGIYFDLASFLNAHQKDWVFRVEYVPRKRLEQTLANGELAGGIVGVNPLWFKDKERTRYAWSLPFMSDRDVVIVVAGRAFPYKQPRDLTGRKMALPRGFYFWGVTELAGEGKIELTETDSDLQCLRMVEAGRAEATISSPLTLGYYTQEQAFPGVLEALPVPHDSYERMVLFPTSLERVRQGVDQVLGNVAYQATWKAVLRPYLDMGK